MDPLIVLVCKVSAEKGISICFCSKVVSKHWLGMVHRMISLMAQEASIEDRRKI